MIKPVAEPESAVRERLLAAALQLFTSRGYAATSVREIVEAAGVTKPALYYYFRNKEGIYLAIIDGALEPYNLELKELLAAGGSARDRIMRICTTAFASARASIDVVRLIFAVYYGPPQGAPHYDFDQLFSQILDGISAAVGDGIAAGEFRAVPLREASWGIMGIFNTIMEEQVCQQEPRIDGQGLVNTLNLFLDAISQGDAK